MGAASSAEEPSKADPLVDKKLTEETPLVESEEKGPGMVKQMQTTGAVVFLISCAVTKTQLTAWLFSYSNYPTAYSFWTCVVTDVILIPFFIIKPSMWAVPTKEMAGVLGMIILFTTFDLGFTNIALANISTALQQCIASTNPFWAITLESIIHKRFQHCVTYTSVFMLVVGAIFALAGSTSVHFNLYGLIAACVAVLCSASKYVFTHKAFSQFKGQLGALALLFWVDLLMMPIFIVWLGGQYYIGGALGMESYDEIVQFYQACFPGGGDLSVFWQMTGTAALGGVRALSQYLVLSLVTATSMSTANIFTQIFNILISIPLQDTPVTASLIIGISLVILFSGFYTFLKMKKDFLPWLDSTVDGRLPCCSRPAKSSGV